MSDPRDALDAVGQLPDVEIDLAGAAIQFARIDAPDADWHAAAEHLSELARDSVALDVTSTDVAARVGALAGLIAGRHRYSGDTETYDDLANANLIHVIGRRRGLPVALGVLWLHAARAAGWHAHGVDFPGHFLLALSGGGRQAVLDVFAGGTPLDVRELRGLIKRVGGEGAELRPDQLRPMGARAVLLRLQYNIVQRRLNANDLEGALAGTEDMLLFAPDQAAQWRDAGLMNRRLDRVSAALRCFERFLALVPVGEAAERVRGVMEELRSRLN